CCRSSAMCRTISAGCDDRPCEQRYASCRRCALRTYMALSASSSALPASACGPRIAMPAEAPAVIVLPRKSNASWSIACSSEAAAVENIQQKIGIGGRLQRLDPPLGLGQLDLKPANGLFGTVSRNLRPPRRRTPGGPELARRHAVLAALCGSGCGRLGFLLARHGEDLLKRGLAAIHQDRIVHCGLL